MPASQKAGYCQTSWEWGT